MESCAYNKEIPLYYRQRCPYNRKIYCYDKDTYLYNRKIYLYNIGNPYNRDQSEERYPYSRDDILIIYNRKYIQERYP